MDDRNQGTEVRGETEASRWEKVVQIILHNLREHLGFSEVHGKGQYYTKTGRRSYEIDAVAYRSRDGSRVLIECRRYTSSRINQEDMGAFAYRIEKVGDEGLMVTCLGFQSGAIDVADEERIGMAFLNPEATESEYNLQIAGQLFRGLLANDNARLSENAVVSASASAHDSGLFTEQAHLTARCDCGGEWVVASPELSRCPKCGR